MENLARFIQEHPFFVGMNDTYIQTLTGCAKNVRFAEGQFIFKEGENADLFYCIRAGQVALEIHAPQAGAIRIDTRKTGDVLGWSWIVAPYHWSCDARAIEEVRALAFDGACLRRKCESNENFGYEMYKRFVPLMHRTLQATRLQLIDVYGTN